MNRIFLEDLPIKNNTVDWKKSVGKMVRFEYNNIADEVKIVGYEINKERHLTIEYNGQQMDFFASSFKGCRIGRILGVVNNDYLYPVGLNLKDEKRDITITGNYRFKTNSSRTQRYYTFKCNICGFESNMNYYLKQSLYKDIFYIRESSLKKGLGCACCKRTIIVPGINDIETTHPHIAKLFKNEEDKNKFSKSTSSVVEVVCPECDTTQEIIVYNLLNRGFNCQNCSNRNSYPERVMGRLLDFIGVEFQRQVGKRVLRWVTLSKKYDFYIKNDNEDIIIETHGGQHYIHRGFLGLEKGKTLKQEQDNDKFKKELALVNGIKEENYIVIDCRESNIEFIKSSILSSRLAEIFDLTTLDWNEIDKLSQKSLVKEVCDYYSLSKNKDTLEIANHFKIARGTAIAYLNKGSKLGFTDYNPSFVNRVSVYKDEVVMGEYSSISNLNRRSKEDFGISFPKERIVKCCNNEESSYKGYSFKYSHPRETT